MGIKKVVPETRVRRKKRMFDYKCANDSSRLSFEETFKLLFSLVLTDQAISSVCRDLTNSRSGIIGLYVVCISVQHQQS